MIVNDEYIIERVEIEERELEQGSSGIHMRYNQTDPSIIRDGVDFIAVTEEGDEKYRVDFQGYAFGRMYITEEGVQELGEKLTTDESRIPSWTLDPETVDADDPPWWLPESVDIEPTVTCDNCAETVAVQNVVTPQDSNDSVDSTVFCQACWDQQ
jgi:hypothetical protein